MTRRQFISTSAVLPAAASAGPAPLIVPLHRMLDSRAKYTQDQFRRFSWSIWPEAVRDFNRCGIQFQGTEGPGEIKRLPGGRPEFVGLERSVINMVITDQIPTDLGGLAGVTTIYEGYHLCIIALRNAHGHQIPFLSVNTCVHELLHALLGDIFINRPTRLQTGGGEFRIDSCASRLWLFNDGAAIRGAAQAYVARLRSTAV